MALTIPDNFKADISGQDISIYPFVLIDADGLNIRISTNAITIGADFHKPLLLNVPSLKESIDLETRKYKINSVVLDISNYKYEGQRFSELVESTSLMNKQVMIYWGSQSTANYDTAFKVYDGTIRRYTHTDEKVKIELEDRSQSYLHRDLPISNLGSDSNVLEKFINKPIPFVYGEVENSPLVNKFNENNRLELIADSGNNTQLFALKTYEEEKYLNIPNNASIPTGDTYIFENTETHPRYKYKNYSIQWEENQNGSSILLTEKTIADAGEYSENPVNDNRLIVYDSSEFKDMVINPLNIKSQFWGNAGWMGHAGLSWYNTLISESENEIEMYGTMLTEEDPDNWDGTSAVRNTGYPSSPTGEDALVYEQLYDDPPNDGDKHQRSLVGITVNTNVASASRFLDSLGLLNFKSELYYANSSEYGTQGVAKIRFRVGGDGDENYYDRNYVWGEVGNTWTEPYPFSNSSEGNVVDINIKIDNINSLLIYGMLKNDSQAGILGFRCKIQDMVVNSVLLMENINNKQYYANVNGRSDILNNAPNIIEDILKTELNINENVDKNFDNLYSDMRYNFSVNEKINSKKLIEEIGSASPYIPYFNNQGEFKINTIPSSKTSSDHIIKESMVIDFSYKRTKIEDVKTKVEFKYKWDYAKRDFDKSVTVSQDANPLWVTEGNNALGIPSVNGYEYYGLESNHDKSTLIIDDHKGKYITDDGTATKFANWLLDYHTNQHLIASIKLPLSVGLPIEVGDILEFDKLLGDVKPYGIDYTTDSLLNNQQIFSNFIVTSTNKTLDSVTVECEQLHRLLEVVDYGWTTLYPANYTENYNHNYVYCIIPESIPIGVLKENIPALSQITQMFWDTSGTYGDNNLWIPTGDRATWNTAGEEIKESTNIASIHPNTNFLNNPSYLATCYKIELFDDSEVTTDLFTHNMNSYAQLL